MPKPGTEMDERAKLAFTSAADACKQVLTLTTAIVTLTISFAKDITKDATLADQRWLRLAWIAYAVSVLAGSWALLAMTGSIGRAATKGDPGASIYRSNITLPVALQMTSFALGVVLTVAYGIFAL
jgi:hypothetical protein